MVVDNDYNIWLDSIFNRSVAEKKPRGVLQFGEDERSFEQQVIFATHLFENPKPQLRRSAGEQIIEGLSFLGSEDGILRFIWNLLLRGLVGGDLYDRCVHSTKIFFKMILSEPHVICGGRSYWLGVLPAKIH